MVLNLSANRLSPARALNALAPLNWRHNLREAAEKVRALHPRGTPPPPPDWDVYTALEAQCSGKDALALLIDEAHTLDASVGIDLFNAWQSLSPTHRIMLVMAGTPDLVDHVNAMWATYASRSKKILVGRMPPDGAREALLAPLRESGVTLTPSPRASGLGGLPALPVLRSSVGRKAVAGGAGR